MNAAVARGNLFRLACLLVVTGSATALTLYLLTPNSPTLSPAMCGAAIVTAWVSVVCAWREHRPHLRGWSAAHTVFLVAVELLMILSAFAGPLSQPTRQEQDRRRHCLALQTAIQTQDLASVEAALRFADTPELLATRSGWDRDMRAQLVNPLELAVTTDNLAIVAVLLDQGASACSAEGYDLSLTYSHEPLPIAAGHGNVPMMRLLLHHGAIINDGDGNCSVLWRAVNANKKEAVAFLLQCGANPNCYRSDAEDAKWSALRLARSRGDDAITRLLLQAGAKENKASEK